MYSGHALDVKGVCHIEVQHKSTKWQMDFYIVHTKSPAILGLDACTQLGLVKLVLSVHTNRPTYFTTEFKHVFSWLGKFEGEHHIHIDPSYPPVVHPPRRIPHAIKDRVNTELD